MPPRRCNATRRAAHPHLDHRLTLRRQRSRNSAAAAFDFREAAYFGHDEWSAHAAEVKSLESALTVRGRVLAAFGAAGLERDPDRRGEWLTFVVVGAGPTGVEMAGQIAELARDTLRSDFRSADPGSGRTLLIEAADRVNADRVLTAFPPSLG